MTITEVSDELPMQNHVDEKPHSAIRPLPEQLRTIQVKILKLNVFIQVKKKLFAFLKLNRNI